MKHEVNRRYSHKIWLLGALMLPLAGCNAGTTGSVPLPADFNVGVGVNDSLSVVTVTKTIIAPATPGTPAVPPTDTTPGSPAVPGTPEKTTFTASSLGPVSFVFSSRPASDAGYVTGYRIVSETVNGIEVLSAPGEVQSFKSNVYVPSGYVCPIVNPIDPSLVHSKTQSCDVGLATTMPGNGEESLSLSISFTGGLENVVASLNTSAYVQTEIEFVGVTSRSKSFALKARVNTVANLVNGTAK